MLTRFFFLFLFCAGTASAQQGQLAPPPARLILSDATASPIELQQLTITSDISGGMAETTVRMVFFNPNRRQLEGNLQFPLSEGQQITGFALDVDGKLRAAVPVDKARGRQVFEAITRRQVDPGLLEVTQGNNFKLRVYPIMPMASRMVELRYSEALVRRGDGWAYRLPLAYGQVRALDLKIRINDSDAAPQASGAIAGLAFEQVKNGFETTLTRERINAAGSIDIVTRAPARARVYQQAIEESNWFVAEIPFTSQRTARRAPRVIGLLWDSSASGTNRAIDAELAELDRYFKAIGNADVRLIRLRDRAEAAQNFRIKDGSWSALRRELAQTVYDGATALNAWKVDPSVDQYLLFSDGLSNYGSGMFPSLAAHQQLFALNSALSADRSRLAALAERKGGALIEVNPATPGAAAQALLFQDARIDNISANGATDIEVDSPTVRNGMLRVAGRRLASQGALTISMLNAGKHETITVPLPADAAQHPRAGAIWASYRLRALEADFEMHRSEIGRIGRRFGIPTRETSLIVLEQMSDYVRYDITPPLEYRDQFDTLKRNAVNLRATERNKHFENVVRMYEQRKAWWARTFPTTPAPDQQSQKAAALALGRNLEQSERRREAPALAPSPAPVMAMAAPPPPSAEASTASHYSRSKEKKAGSPSAPVIGMALQKWVPNAPYMDRLKRASADQVYRVYHDLRADYANSSAFYLDAADILFAKGKPDLALRVLSNLAEMDLENRAVLRILGYRLLQAGAPQLAIAVFEEVQRIATEEPQSFRDLGLALAAAGRSQEALDMLYEVALRPWDNRFPDIESIAIAELNEIVANSGKRLDTSRVDKRLLANLPLDLRVVLTWDADNTDMDLYVTDPSGERCSYANNATRQGGRMTRDFTGGYGPEEFSLRRAQRGKYKIEVNYYGSRQQVIAGATTLQVKMFSGFGTARQKEQLVTLRLQEKSETVFVGEFEVKP
jgi:Ca-activated chloride channel family protein